MKHRDLFITVCTVILGCVALMLFIQRLHPKAELNEEAGTPEGDLPPNGIPGTAHFTLSEFHCKDGSQVPNGYYGNLQFLMEQLEVIRQRLGVPMHVNSGYRSLAYNSSLSGSATNSQHLRAKAADITAPGYTASKVHSIIEELMSTGRIHNGGLGSYSSFTHYDVGPGPRRWNG